MRQPHSDDDVIDLTEIIAMVWRGKWLVGLVMVVFVLIGGLQAYVLATPTFRATSSLVLETREQQVVDLDNVLGSLRGDTSTINTEVEVLRGRQLAGQVVDVLGLMEDPEFNGILRTPDGLSLLIANARAQVGALVDQITGADPVPEVEPDDKLIRERVITDLMQRVSVANVPLTFVFTISVETESGQKSARIADTFAQLHIENQIRAKFDAIEEAIAFLGEQVVELQIEVDRANADLAAFRATTDIVDASVILASEQQLASLRTRITETMLQQSRLQERMNALQAAATAQQKAAIAEDPILVRLLAEAGDAGAGAAAFETRFEQIIEGLDQEMRRISIQLDTLNVSRETLERTINRQSADLVELQQMVRAVESSSLLYEYFVDRLRETSVQQGLQRADSRILSQAVVPERPFSPQKNRTLAIAGVLGGIVGIALVLLVQMRRNTFVTARGLEQSTGISVVGQMPVIKGRTRRKILMRLIQGQATSAAEAVRNLRTTLLMSDPANPPQIILVSSSLPDEGKTVMAMALANNLVGIDKRILLIDGDLRRGAVGQAIKAPDAKAGQASRQEGAAGATAIDIPGLRLIKDDPMLRADLLLSENFSGNPADFLGSDRFAAMIARLRQDYDHIVIDSPPCLVVPDARIIAGLADFVVLAVRWNRTTEDQVFDALQMFTSVKKPVGGIVMTRVNERQIRQFGRNGNYASYGRDYYAGS